MKLFFNMASPFVRKVRVFARETGLDKNIEEITTMVSPVQENRPSRRPIRSRRSRH